MSIVTLVSGGLDSSLMTILARDEGIEVHPLFIDYGQRARVRELRACMHIFESFKLPKPRVADLSGIGKLIRCGLTSPDLDVRKDAFLPGRNLLFLLVGASHAYQLGASAVAIGLLSEEAAIFPDQTNEFVASAERTLKVALGWPIKIITPLMGFTKSEVVAVSHQFGITNTYSCHVGKDKPCGACISCLEYETEEGK